MHQICVLLTLALSKSIYLLLTYLLTYYNRKLMNLKNPMNVAVIGEGSCADSCSDVCICAHDLNAFKNILHHQ